MNKWQAVVFDLDDTLYPERDYVLSGFNAVTNWAETALDIPAQQGFAELSALFESGVRGDTFNSWLVAHQIAPKGDLIGQLVKVYREHEPKLMPFPEIPLLLERLNKRCKLGLVSDGYLDVQRKKWAALKLQSYFQGVVFSDELGRECWKPSAKPFELVAQRLEIEPSSAIYVADNPKKDFPGAHEVGMSTIWLRRSGGEYSDLEPPTPQHAPRLTLTSFSELIEFFEAQELLF